MVWWIIAPRTACSDHVAVGRRICMQEWILGKIKLEQHNTKENFVAPIVLSISLSSRRLFKDGPQLISCATWPRRPAGTTIAFQFRTPKRFWYRFYVRNWNVIVVTSWPARPSCAQNQLRTVLKSQELTVKPRLEAHNYGHDHFWSVFEENRRNSTTTYITTALFILLIMSLYHLILWKQVWIVFTNT